MARLETVTIHHCQICDEVSALNRLVDGSIVCSCPAHREFVPSDEKAETAWIPKDA